MTTVEINGYAGRAIRELLGFKPTAVAKKMQVGLPYVSKMENGHTTRVSTVTFRRWQEALLVADPRALMANPHSQVLNTNGNGDTQNN